MDAVSTVYAIITNVAPGPIFTANKLDPDGTPDGAAITVYPPEAVSDVWETDLRVGYIGTLGTDRLGNYVFFLARPKGDFFLVPIAYDAWLGATEGPPSYPGKLYSRANNPPPAAYTTTRGPVAHPAGYIYDHFWTSIPNAPASLSYGLKVYRFFEPVPISSQTVGLLFPNRGTGWSPEARTYVPGAGHPGLYEGVEGLFVVSLITDDLTAPGLWPPTLSWYKFPDPSPPNYPRAWNWPFSYAQSAGMENSTYTGSVPIDLRMSHDSCALFFTVGVLAVPVYGVAVEFWVTDTGSYETPDHVIFGDTATDPPTPWLVVCSTTLP